MRDNTGFVLRAMVCMAGMLSISALLFADGGCRTALAAEAQSFDILIKGVTVYDGTLKPPYIADIGVKGDRIAAIGKLKGKAAMVIDAGGYQSCPASTR